MNTFALRVNTLKPLPIDDVLPELRQTLQQPGTLLLSAAPGAGKTTRVPLALLDEEWLAGQRIVMLEPRRIAARHAAQFMAQQLGEPVGQRVGYRIRLETRVSAQTRIEVVTEGVLTRLLQDDPELSGIGLVIFDEFHERNLHADLALALTHQCQQLLRPDLRLLIMSATLDEQGLSSALEAPLLISQGRSFPVDIHYLPNPNANQSITEHTARVIRQALQHPGDMLVFLPGVREIRQVQQTLEDLPPGIQCLPLHGQLSDAEQKAALMPAASGQRKILLATNIAESSLTVDGVRIVVDSGLERRSVFHLASGLHSLQTRQISRASATQRSGRAGRQADGVCYRLWSAQQHERLDAQIRAEILDADLSSLRMALGQWGADADELFWLTPPPDTALRQAETLLQQLGILHPETASLSDHGNACARLGIEPRWAHALLSAHALGYGEYACTLVALVQEWPGTRRSSDDLLRLLSHARQQRGLWQQRIQPLAQNLWRTLQGMTPEPHTTDISKDDLPALLLALAYPDRIAKRRDQREGFLLSQGRGAECSPESDLAQTTWLACADLSTHGQRTIIRLATELSSSALAALKQIAPQLFTEVTEIGWQDSGQFIAQRHQQLGQIRLRSQRLPELNAEQWQAAWQHFIQQRGLDCLPWSTEALNLRARIALMHQHAGAPWPDVSDSALLEKGLDWLLPYLHNARHQRDLDKIDTGSALRNLLSWEQQQQLDKQLPTHLSVPSGSRIAIDYTQQPPVLAVKLQEMFGYEGQPSVLNGQVPLLIHLLSPARRPLQVTADLPHFWRNTYADVRKEMRGRYPKHPWPEDPLSAEATRLTKAALQRRKGPV
ncbi:ATP-dependent helicase HrpB [Nitrincola lacisaponensis]|uniref:ATP-dependent helicase HrpB n=1 Tax=Nitrincola lacisaponensis TaxID=267850 RepID=A0A063Y0I3_9GAMM|nr:ATP-dependent helicase HrpB [Nitrincola lacisaponensis]KDE38690.1 ATP-dependent helicase HrpB [Nitrincola lacisaponensis]